jgi:uncharacterized OsmC-like protein
MKIHMHTEEDLEFTEFAEPAFELVPSSADQQYSALQMFATAMALCTYSVLFGYGENIDTDVERIRIRIRWAYAEHPFRIDRLEMDVHWPELPESRLEAARRAAAHCTLHNTLEHPPRITTTVERDA